MSEAVETNEWTLMFFFAGDNDLAPSMISELKAIKAAGFQKNASALVYFDPNELGSPTRLYNVNRKRKAGAAGSIIGDGRDPYVRNMIEDQVDPDDIDESAGDMSKDIKEALKGSPDELKVEDALRLFLGFCRENYRAKNYMLFLIGHGMIVGNDAFLPDNNPVASLSLEQLHKILSEFADGVRSGNENEKGEFQLLTLHSCSMSSVEVAYQLKGTANYMMATQGLSFVGSWPYRQLLKKTFNAIETAKEKQTEITETARQAGGTVDAQDLKNADVDVPELMRKLYYLTLHNATDFMAAGYSSELALCSLRTKEVETLKAPIQNLAARLRDALKSKDERVKELILLAHWKSQSYWQENYTDLFDFCKCLSETCDAGNELQKQIGEDCGTVMEAINTLVVHSEHFGPTYQYSHGLSIYFPWSRPIENPNNSVLGRYEKYKFTTELGGPGGDSWLGFLNSYFVETRRSPRLSEDGKDKMLKERFPAAFAVARESFIPSGALDDDPPPIKPRPSTGVDCSCASIKNFPEEDREIKGRTIRNVEAFSISEGALSAFRSDD